MAYHLIPFVAGTVVGGLAVYLFGDKRFRRDLRQSAGALSRKAQATAGQVSGKVSTGISQVRASMAGPGRTDDVPTPGAVEPEVKGTTPKPRASVRKPAARKSATRATARRRAERAIEPTEPETPEDI